MRLAHWSWGGRPHVGLLSPDGRELTPLAAAQPALGALPLIQALASGEPLPPPSGARLPAAAVTLAAPLPRPLRSVFCAGRNYRAHAEELATTVFRDSLPEKDAWPIVFTKLAECVAGPFDTVRLPGAQVTVQIDYESELAVVIGRGGRDVSARDVQVRHQQWDLGKSFDTFLPMGPCIVSADELDGRDTRVRGWLIARNAEPELRQDGRTKDMIFDIPTLIETCSRGITLFPGDVIATGTPSGVGMGFQPPKWLGAGDRFRIEIDGIGAIENLFDHAG
jgi:2-keto-4-pentenoate hydratase/2-oxohepta-3-ene-1,7-dioic acid hydratase in catechol pathway